MFELTAEDKLIVRLDGYAVIPIEEYEAIKDMTGR
jgi:hypothetical protein